MCQCIYMNTMPRSLRIPEDLWHAAVAKAKAEGTTVTAIVVKALKSYTNRGSS